MAGALYLNFHVLHTARGVCGSSDVAPGLGCGAQVPLKLLQTEGIGVSWLSLGQVPPTRINIRNYLPCIRVAALGEVLQNWEHRQHSRMEILLICVACCGETALALEGTC